MIVRSASLDPFTCNSHMAANSYTSRSTVLSSLSLRPRAPGACMHPVACSSRSASSHSSLSSPKRFSLPSAAGGSIRGRAAAPHGLYATSRVSPQVHATLSSSKSSSSSSSGASRVMLSSGFLPELPPAAMRGRGVVAHPWSGVSERQTRERAEKQHGAVEAKMHVPGYGKSPEARAADSLSNFFTFMAVKNLLKELEKEDPHSHSLLDTYASTVSFKDGDHFCFQLMREGPKQKMLAMRILEDRSAYAKEGFNWVDMVDHTFVYTKEANTSLMRDFLMETLALD